MAKEDKKVVDKVEKPVEKPAEKPVKKGVSVDKFVARKLKALNQMGDQRKARELAQRIMSNARKGK